MSIIYELAIVEDHGSYWRVSNVVKNTIDSLANREEKMLKLSYVAYQQIKEALNNNNIVHITKSLSTDEVLPGELYIVNLTETDPIKDRRIAALTKVRMLVTPEIAKISGFALYGFMVLNNDLVNAGFAITNDNREEKYLEILETGDESLITKLEDYLNYKDEIERISQLERKFSKFQRDISSSTEEDIDEIESIFLEEFYKNY